MDGALGDNEGLVCELTSQPINDNLVKALGISSSSSHKPENQEEVPQPQLCVGCNSEVTYLILPGNKVFKQNIHDYYQSLMICTHHTLLVQQSSKARIDKFLVFQKIVDPVCLHCGHAHDPKQDQSLEFQAPDAS